MKWRTWLQLASGRTELMYESEHEALARKVSDQLEDACISIRAVSGHPTLPTSYCFREDDPANPREY